MRWIRFSLVWLALFATTLGGYKILRVEVKEPASYSAHQDFQQVVIGAWPAISKEDTRALFDTDKVFKKGILPVLVVIQNDNEFPLSVSGRDIHLNPTTGDPIAPLPVHAVIRTVTSGKPLSYDVEEIKKRKGPNQDLVDDFLHKDFGDKLVAPYSRDWGIVFFPRPEDGQLEGSRLYLPEILNASSYQSLIYFEFDLF